MFAFFSLSLPTILHCYDVIMYAVEIWGNIKQPEKHTIGIEDWYKRRKVENRLR